MKQIPHSLVRTIHTIQQQTKAKQNRTKHTEFCEIINYIQCSEPSPYNLAIAFRNNKKPIQKRHKTEAVHVFVAL